MKKQSTGILLQPIWEFQVSAAEEMKFEEIN